MNSCLVTLRFTYIERLELAQKRRYDGVFINQNGYNPSISRSSYSCDRNRKLS